MLHKDIRKPLLFVTHCKKLRFSDQHHGLGDGCLLPKTAHDGPWDPLGAFWGSLGALLASLVAVLGLPWGSLELS